MAKNYCPKQVQSKKGGFKCCSTWQNSPTGLDWGLRGTSLRGFLSLCRDYWCLPHLLPHYWQMRCLSLSILSNVTCSRYSVSRIWDIHLSTLWVGDILKGCSYGMPQRPCFVKHLHWACGKSVLLQGTWPLFGVKSERCEICTFKLTMCNDLVLQDSLNHFFTQEYFNFLRERENHCLFQVCCFWLYTDHTKGSTNACKGL